MRISIRKQYVKTGVIEAKFSELIRNVESIRHDCDYSDFYTPNKDELQKQLEIAKEFVARIGNMLE